MTEWSGEDYANISALQRAMAEDAVASVQFAGNEQVLDVGCGDGHVTRMIAGMVPDGYVVGIDPSQGMLGEAVRAGAAQSRVAERWAVARPTPQNITLFYKDLALALELAGELGIDLPAAALVQRRLDEILAESGDAVSGRAAG